MAHRQWHILPALCITLAGLPLSVQAAVTLTGASGGGAISADTGTTGGSGAWTTLGPITIAEGSSADLSAGTNVTLVLKAPAGFEFNTNSLPSVSFNSPGDITAASVALPDAATLKVLLTVISVTNTDNLVLGTTGLQVRPLSSAPLPVTRHIYRASSGGGTLVANGITNSADGSTGSNFGTLTEVAGTFVKLLLLMPGETAAPGTLNGKTGSPTARTAGSAFNVTVDGVDTNWNVVPSANGTNFTVQITSTDTNATVPAANDLASGTRTFSVTLKTAGTSKVTATDLDDGTKTASTSPSTTVNPGAFAKLQVLLPGQSPVPGSSTGKIGNPTAQTAGAAFSVTARSVDANWNLISTNDLVHITSTDTNATLPADAPLTNGSSTFSIVPKTAGSRTVTASNLTHTGITANTSSTVSIAAAAYAQLQVLMPGQGAAPGTSDGKTGSPTARTAGVTFTNLAVRAVDSFWNLVATNVTVAIASSDSSAALPENTALGATGSKTNFSITFKTAGQQTISARDINDRSKTNVGSITTVTPGTFSRLQVLVPGEIASPGTPAGKTGSPLPEQVQRSFTIIVNSVDTNWNVLNTNDVIHVTSSDPQAVLPADAVLNAGTGNFNVTLSTPGTNLTVAASDITNPTIAAGTSAPLIVTASSVRGGLVVAIHDSEFTRNLESLPASPPTPSGPGTTGKQWWTTNWHYFVMVEALKEALRSDGTPFEVVSDADIIAGRLIDTNGGPNYPIVISLASEAIADTEILQFTNYVAAGGFLLAGSSAFTRDTNGVPRGDFAFANELGLHRVVPGVTNWRASGSFVKALDHRLVAHIPTGALFWEMPAAADEISWRTYPHPANPTPQALMWQVQAGDAEVIASGDLYPYLADKAYGKGRFIYHAAMQPLIAHGGWGCGMYAYVIFRKAIEWAFESARMPLLRLSPWPYPYDAAFMVRHDLEDYSSEIANIEASARAEYTNGIQGDYFFCTGTLRADMSNTFNTNAVVASLQRAVSNYHATIGPHNGGLRNPFNSPPLTNADFDFWHWGPDEALDVTPPGYPDGKTYALVSVSNSFLDVENWLPGLMTNGMRVWAAPYFDSTREASYDILSQLNVKLAGEEKLSPFPHWTLSTQTSGKHYPFLTLPVSDWYVGNTVSQSMEAGHNTNSVHALVDFYYELGALINLYSHTLSTGLGTAAGLAPEYLTYGLNTNLHPRVWPANSVALYNWWLQRSNAQLSVAYSVNNGNNATISCSVSGATDTNTSVESVIPAGYTALQVFTNAIAADTNAYRLTRQGVKLLVGTAVTNAVFSYHLSPRANDDWFAFSSGPILNVAAPGVLANDTPGASNAPLVATLVSGPANGALSVGSDGSFNYVPGASFSGTDSFIYKVNDGIEDSAPATVTLANTNAISFADDFTRASDPGSVAPWIVRAGAWTVTGGEMQTGTNAANAYANAYLTNTWSDYAAQARVRFPTGAFGGALGGRLNELSGAHYAAWIYPEGSPGASNVLRLIKFSNWASWTPIQQVNLAAVGTNYHTVKLAFHQTHIAVYLDGNLMISASDASAWLSGGISLDLWTADTGYVAAFDDVTVTPLLNNDSYIVNQNEVLGVSAPGVLGNDTDVYGANLMAVAASSPAHGAVSLNANGGFTYIPDPDYSGSDDFIYQATDGPTSLGSAWVYLTVVPVNPAPLIQSITFSNDAVALQWTATAGRNYRLQFKSDWSDPNWNDVVPDLTASGPSLSATNDVAGDQQRFYRVLLLP